MSQIKPYFIIAGTSRGEDKKQVFWAIDSHSGGYPYWVDYIEGAERYPDVVKAKNQLDSSGYMFEQATDIKVFRATVVLEVVSAETIEDELRRAALAKLSDKEKQLLGLV